MKTLNLEVCNWISNEDIQEVGVVFTTSAQATWHWCCVNQSTQRPENLRNIAVEVEDKPLHEKQPDDLSLSTDGGDYHEMLWQVVAVQDR